MFLPDRVVPPLVQKLRVAPLAGIVAELRPRLVRLEESIQVADELLLRRGDLPRPGRGLEHVVTRDQLHELLAHVGRSCGGEEQVEVDPKVIPSATEHSFLPAGSAQLPADLLEPLHRPRALLSRQGHEGARRLAGILGHGRVGGGNATVELPTQLFGGPPALAGPFPSDRRERRRHAERGVRARADVRHQPVTEGERRQRLAVRAHRVRRPSGGAGLGDFRVRDLDRRKHVEDVGIGVLVVGEIGVWEHQQPAGVDVGVDTVDPRTRLVQPERLTDAELRE